MLSLGSFAFTSPWLLAALAALPALWWLLRVTPPAPRRLHFPAIRLLLGLRPREETPARTPLWLILLRMALAVAVILALAHPLLNPNARLAAAGPLVLLVDDDWAAAHDWAARQRAMGTLIAQAGRERRDVVLLATAPRPGGDAGPPASLQRAVDADAAAKALQPHPWPAVRSAALARLDRLGLHAANPVWLSDGLYSADAVAVAERLQRLGPLRVLSDPPGSLARLLAPATTESADLAVALHRADIAGPARMTVRASGEDGRLLTRSTVTLPPGQDTAEARLPMPTELRNQAARIEIEGEASAGAVLLLDERWRRRPVGIVGRPAGEAAQPLLSGSYYLERALAPFSEVRRGPADDLLKRPVAMIILADRAPASGAERAALVTWMNAGGVLLRFAGPQLAEADDDLLPVTLRRGGRTLGGTMSWEQPAHLAPFTADGPFAGLAVPTDVTVSRQVLAEPAPGLEARTWARLSDGTPLVTGERRGKGWLVLIHTTASPDWSNLAMSGLFVDMLRRLLALSQGVGGIGDRPLAPLEVLDGFGRLRKPSAEMRPIAAARFGAAIASASQPPGYYGTTDERHALNLAGAVQRLAPLGPLPAGIARESYAGSPEVDLRPPLLAAAMVLLLLDLAIAYALRGLLSGLVPRRRGTALGLALAVLAPLALGAPSARAEGSTDAFALQATSGLHLAYIETGDPEIDQESRAGLTGLGQVLGRRTAVETAEPMAVDPDRDELIFFPLIYWPVTAAQPPLSQAAIARLNHFIATGGTLFIDSRDQNLDDGTRLRQLTAGLAIPPLEPVPPDHILTKSFYLMQEFPGRWTGGRLWVEPSEDNVNDGVSTVIVGSDDYAGAWAIDAEGRPAFPVVPGGERQREMAYRFGVNLVMYTLTGNYKSDQVHVPAILERLGQ